MKKTTLKLNLAILFFLSIYILSCKNSQSENQEKFDLNSFFQTRISNVEYLVLNSKLNEDISIFEDSLRIIKIQINDTELSENYKSILINKIEILSKTIEAQVEKTRQELVINKKNSENQYRNSLIGCLTNNEWSGGESIFGFEKNGNGYVKVNWSNHKNRFTWKYQGGNKFIIYMENFHPNGYRIQVEIDDSSIGDVNKNNCQVIGLDGF